MDGGTFDGLTMDEEGCVWVARWKSECFERNETKRKERVREELMVLVLGFGSTGSRVVKYKPDGSIGLEIKFPNAANITCCIFGGQLSFLENASRLSLGLTLSRSFRFIPFAQARTWTSCTSRLPAASLRVRRSWWRSSPREGICTRSRSRERGDSRSSSLVVRFEARG